MRCPVIVIGVLAGEQVASAAMSIQNDAAVGRERDPVCGMSVRLDAALEEGLVAEHEGHTYYFCRTACRDALVASPTEYTTYGHTSEPAASYQQPAVDAGICEVAEAGESARG